jgi:hypothetical protein
MFRFLIALAVLAPAQAQPPRLAVSTTEATTADTWTYTIAADAPMTVVDRLDTRLAVQDLSPACAVAPSGVRVDCTVDATAPVTITVRIRRNPCEPDLCRNIDWTILNWVEGAGQRSNVVAVRVRTPELPHPPRRHVLWLPLVTAPRSQTT